MNYRVIVVILVCFTLAAGGIDSADNEEIQYDYDVESRVYDHNFTSVMGSQFTIYDSWSMNNTSWANTTLHVGYQESPLSQGWLNITLVTNDTVLFSENHTERGHYFYEGISDRGETGNWTIFVNASGSDYTLADGGMFHDRIYVNMTTEYYNQTR